MGPDENCFGVVGPVGVAARAQGVVVVVEQEQPPVSEREDALDGLEGERKGISETYVSLARRLRDPGWVPNGEQVEHLLLDQETLGVRAPKVYEVDLLEARFLALLVVALDRQKATGA